MRFFFRFFFFEFFFSRRNAPHASPRHLESVRRRSEVPGRRPAKLARPRGPRAPRSTTARPRARPPTRPQRPSRPRRRSGLVPGGPRSLPRGGAREKKNRKKSRYRPEGAHFRADLLYFHLGVRIFCPWVPPGFARHGLYSNTREKRAPSRKVHLIQTCAIIGCAGKKP